MSTLSLGATDSTIIRKVADLFTKHAVLEVAADTKVASSGKCLAAEAGF